MTVFDSNSSLRWLFCMTHPDDEISICAWIKHLTSIGAEVYINWTHSPPVREAEARIVSTILGVPDSNLTFMGATDGSVCEEMEGLLPKFRLLMERVKPDRVCCGAFEQGHLDHDATNFLVNQTFDGPVLEIPLYHSYVTRLQKINTFAEMSGAEIRPLTPSEQALKLQIAKAFRSQNIWSVLWWYEVWQAVQFKPVALRKRELMRRQVHTDFARPNLPEDLAAKVIQSASWRRWKSAVERANMPP
ncbi:MAG: PIG-L family deacetylase [Fimbriimonadaceae bacterium]|nr:PIG-L family deacetylase [Fimbriimonadaceae bacterium]